jgi:luciferase family oxidoreductase group 1
MSVPLVPISILDLAFVDRGCAPKDSFAASVAIAQLAERTGYKRVWYAEHHNMPTIASSAPAVLIAHVAAHTKSIRLGAGGVMLPNHAPLTIAEQFGTLAALHPDRIDLGLGRAPGTDPVTTRALRRSNTSSDTFPEDVRELQGYLGDCSRIAGVEATPGKDTNVPLYILGSSLFGAKLAAAFGLPYAFASHFAPSALQEAVALYRMNFRPSAQLQKPHVIAGVNVVAADTTKLAEEQFLIRKLSLIKALLGKGQDWTDEDAMEVLESGAGRQLVQMVTYSAVGTPEEVRAYLDRFVRIADADELMVAHHGPSIDARLRSVELLAGSMQLLAA